MCYWNDKSLVDKIKRKDQLIKLSARMDLVAIEPKKVRGIAVKASPKRRKRHK